MSKTTYIDAQDLYNEIQKYQKSENKVISDKYAYLCVELCNNMLKSHNFSRYPWTLKEDMKSFALQKLMRAIVLFDLSKPVPMAFSYLTRTVYTAFLNIIGKHYKEVNGKNKYMIDTLTKRGLTAKQIEDVIGRKEAVYTTNSQKDNPFNNYKARSGMKKKS